MEAEVESDVMERRAMWVRVCHSWEEEAAADREYWARYSGDEKVAMIAEMVDEWENRGVRTSPSSHGNFLEALNHHSVGFLVVGAYSLSFHAQPQHTMDLDILVESTPANAHAVVKALDDFGFGSLNFSPADFLEAERVTQLGHEPKRIDILTSIRGVTFAEAWAHRQEGVLDGERAYFLSKADLIRSKEAAGRPRDLMDLEFLR